MILKSDGSTRQTRGLFRLLEEDEKEALLIRGGQYNGRNALEVLTEAVEWLEDYILSSIRRAGYDPEERRYAGTLLPIEERALNSSRTLLS